MKTAISIQRLSIILTFITIPVLLFSQEFDKQMEHAAHRSGFSEVPYISRQPVRATVPLITAMVAAVNTDTLHKTLRQLQNWGTRFMLNDNRKQIATSLMNKFLSYGYTDVKLDSFYNTQPNFYIDSTWQYNVVCNVAGVSAPNEIYVIGGHYDSYSNGDPYTIAPGIDDNGSSTAATLEIARVMAQMNYHPQATIRFVLFAAEELGLFGSQYDAQKSHLAGNDIRYMFNMDMIANDPTNLNKLRASWYTEWKWTCSAATEAINRYTDLSVIIDDVPNGGSDCYSYWAEGFPTFSCMEYAFSPYYHSPADTLGNCNIPFLAKVTGGALATMAEQQLFPTPQNITAHSGKNDITINWKPTNNALVQGVNVYRSETKGSQYVKINTTPFSGAIFHDSIAEPNRQYYYVLTAVNDSLQEGGYSDEVYGARFNFCDSLLVLANLKGNLITPDSVYAFYHAALDTIPFVWHDINLIHKVTLGMLSRYRSILWMTNTPFFEVQDNALIQDVSEFVTNGGNLLFAGYNPMKFWMNGPTYPIRTPDESLFRQLFKVDSVNRKAQCMMFRANAVAPGYDTLNVDTLKYSDTNFPGQIYNVEVFSPAQDAGIIYRLDTKYDSTSSFGKMKNRPVGLEYLGTDFKSILLSFPLYCMDTNDVRKFFHYVMSDRFTHPAGIKTPDAADPFNMQIYPNPVSDIFTVTYNLAKPGRVKLTLLSMQGQILKTWNDNKPERGTHSLLFDMGFQAPGFYYVVLQSYESKAVKKIVRLR